MYTSIDLNNYVTSSPATFTDTDPNVTFKIGPTEDTRLIATYVFTLEVTLDRFPEFDTTLKRTTVFDLIIKGDPCMYSVIKTKVISPMHY